MNVEEANTNVEKANNEHRKGRTITAEEAIKSYLTRNGISTFSLKAALIDMDGVLYDSMPNHTRAWKRMAEEMGITCTREEFYAYEGMTGIATINILFRRAFNRDVTADEATALYAKKQKYFRSFGSPRLMPNADRMLGVLRSSGITRVLVTGSGQQSILQRIDRDYPGIFLEGKRVTAHDVVNGKPDPEPYLRGAQFAGCLPSQCIVIENAPLGITAGHRAGCFVVGITTGPIPDDQMLQAGADILFSGMTEFADALPSLIHSLAVTKL
jgi:HAD superfamily hydrolase (TIGR01509 family)